MTSTLIAYRTPPQMERKALAEAREAGHRAYLPSEASTTKTGTRRVPTARGYVFAEGKPHDAEHIKNAIGPVSRTELRRLYVRTSKTQRRHAFAIGDKVLVGERMDMPAEVAGIIRAGWYEVAVMMMGKRCITKVAEQHIRRQNLHPPT